MIKPLRSSSTRLAVCIIPLLLAFTAAAQAEEVEVQRPGYALQAERHGAGATVVVFESGFGQGSEVWETVIADLGGECQCIGYDRAVEPRTIDAHVQDLAAIIDVMAPAQKVVLVGHSYGGLLATEYSRLHPDRLLGLVLVDPATMGQRHAFRRAAAERVAADDATLLKILPPAMASGYQLLMEQLDDDAAAAPRPQPDLPVALLTSTQVAAEPFVFEETAEGKALWKHQHAELFAAYARGTHQYFATGHNIHREEPKAVAEAIRFVATAAAGER